MSEAEFISFIKELKQFNLDDIQKRLADLLACEARVQELETAIDHALDWISIEDNEDSIKILKDVLGEKQRDAPQS